MCGERRHSRNLFCTILQWTLCCSKNKNKSLFLLALLQVCFQTYSKPEVAPFSSLILVIFFFLSNEVSKVSEELYTLNCFSFHVKTVLKINQQIGPSSKFFLFYGFSPSILFPTYILFLPPFLPLPLPSFPLSFLPSFFP